MLIKGPSHFRASHWLSLQESSHAMSCWGLVSKESESGFSLSCTSLQGKDYLLSMYKFTRKRLFIVPVQVYKEKTVVPVQVYKEKTCITAYHAPCILPECVMMLPGDIDTTVYCYQSLWWCCRTHNSLLLPECVMLPGWCKSVRWCCQAGVRVWDDVARLL